MSISNNRDVGTDLLWPSFSVNSFMACSIIQKFLLFKIEKKRNKSTNKKKIFLRLLLNKYISNKFKLVQ